MNQDFRDLLAEFNARGVEYRVALIRIDVITAIDGIAFENAWATRIHVPFSDQVVPVLSREDLIRNKRAAGREQDLLDVKWLERHPPK